MRVQLSGGVFSGTRSSHEQGFDWSVALCSSAWARCTGTDALLCDEWSSLPSVRDRIAGRLTRDGVLKNAHIIDLVKRAFNRGHQRERSHHHLHIQRRPHGGPKAWARQAKPPSSCSRTNFTMGRFSSSSCSSPLCRVWGMGLPTCHATGHGYLGYVYLHLSRMSFPCQSVFCFEGSNKIDCIGDRAFGSFCQPLAGCSPDSHDPYLVQKRMESTSSLGPVCCASWYTLRVGFNINYVFGTTKTHVNIHTVWSQRMLCWKSKPIAPTRKWSSKAAYRPLFWTSASGK